ncbi:MAG: tetratricopeptide repeat protein [Bacteroidota bacterium]
MMMHPSNHKCIHFLGIIALLTLLSCSKEKDTLPARAYHTTTSYFNGYYNANYLFKETINRLEDAYEFKDEGFIEVVYYGTEEEIKSYDSDFETITKKNDAVLFKHPNGNYVDNCRLLTGKCWLYRQNYTLALKNFNYVLEEFPESDLVPEVWFRIAESHYLMENGEQARSVFQEMIVENDTFYFDEELSAEIALFRTRLAIEDEKYQEAIEVLNENIPYMKGRQRIAKTHFLLGQLYAQNKDFARSLEQYNLVEKYSGDYELAFKAKIRVARLYVEFQDGLNEDSEVYKYLTSLLKDEKNLEYRDQIYYEFALLELKQEHQEKGIEYLKESIRVNVSNDRQKALSYYKIGQIYFYEEQDYDLAQTYYDSAATTISPQSPEYKEITTLAATLKEYITQKNTIHYQDSMLTLAALPEKELEALIDKLVEEDKKRKEEEARRLLEQMNSNNLNDPFYNPQLQNVNRNNNRRNQGAMWYFDNPSTISNGKLEFQQRWGQRRNEDNWRRSKKTSSLAFGNGNDNQAQAEPEVVDSTLFQAVGKDRYQYYKDIPKTDEEIVEVTKKIEEAMYKLGQVYSQKLNEPDSAIETFEGLIDRFRDGDYNLQTRYALYQLYREKHNNASRVHENYILDNHPNSVYAYLIQGRDPNELKKSEEEFRFAYDGLLNAYVNQMYESSVGFSEFLLAQADFGENPDLDMAQLQYIRGMSYGYIGERDSLERILTHVVSTYPSHDVTPKAQKTLDFLKNGIPTASPKGAAGAAAEEVDKNDPRFKGFSEQPKASDKIFVIMYVDKTKISKNDANSKISNFNKSYTKQKKLKVFTFMYQQTHLLPYISHFTSVEDAKAYMDAFAGSPASKEVIMSEEEKIFYISHSNFKVAYGQKRMEDYIAFFESVLNK